MPTIEEGPISGRAWCHLRYELLERLFRIAADEATPWTELLDTLVARALWQHRSPHCRQRRRNKKGHFAPDGLAVGAAELAEKSVTPPRPIRLPFE